MVQGLPTYLPCISKLCSAHFDSWDPLLVHVDLPSHTVSGKRHMLPTDLHALYSLHSFLRVNCTARNYFVSIVELVHVPAHRKYFRIALFVNCHLKSSLLHFHLLSAFYYMLITLPCLQSVDPSKKRNESLRWTIIDVIRYSIVFLLSTYHPLTFIALRIYFIVALQQLFSLDNKFWSRDHYFHLDVWIVDIASVRMVRVSTCFNYCMYPILLHMLVLIAASAHFIVEYYKLFSSPIVCFIFRLHTTISLIMRPW